MELIVISNLFPNKKEPNRGLFNYQQINNLSLKCKLTVVAPISWVDASCWEKHEELAITQKYTVVHPKYYYTPKILRFMYGYFYYLSIIKRVRSLISKSRPSAIFSTWAYPDSFASCLIAKSYNLPLIIKVHGTDIHSVRGALRRWLTSWTLRSSKEIISVSMALKEIMIREFNVPQEKIFVIPNGVDKNKFYPMSVDEINNLIDIPINSNNNCLFIGNLKTEKNISLLVRAFVEVVRKYGNHNVLHVIGGGALYKQLSEFIVDNKMSNNIILHGVIEHSLIPGWMNAADLLILPSDNEGMPNVVLEAKACGTPVLLSDIDAHRELIEQGINGYLFNLNDTNDLVEKINKSLNENLNDGAKQCIDSVISWEENADILMSRFAS